MNKVYERLVQQALLVVVGMVCAVLLATTVRAEGWSAAGSLATGRIEHTATLLPDGRVLVAGGDSGSAALNSAELYDPATDSWSAAGSLTTGRYNHTATLLPDGRVLVAGGYTGSVRLSSAELYDPSSDSWSAAGALTTGRYDHTATLLSDGRVLVAGGRTASGALASAELYDPATDSWTAATPLITGRYAHTAILLPDGRVLVAGGFTGSAVLTSVELYDPSIDSWLAADPLTTGRYFHTGTLLRDGRVLVAGGSDGALSDVLASAELYDPDSDSWSAAAPMAAGLDLHTATLLADGRVLLAGGIYTGSSDAELYDPETDSWSLAESLANKRWWGSSTLLTDGRVLVAGGAIPFGGDSSSAELFDPTSDNWSSAGSLSVARENHSATLLPDGLVLVAGGDGGGGTLSTTELYDPSAKNWSTTDSLATGRSYHSATTLLDGRVLVACGISGSTFLSSAELYNPSTGKWSTAASLAAARYYHSATLLADGSVLVAGGFNTSTGVLSSAEQYDPSTDTWLPASPLAIARFAHSATRLNDNNVLIVAGYGSSGFLSSAELYDPSSKSWSAAGPLATGRQYHSATLLPDGRVLVAGGYGSAGALTSAELYDPSSKSWSAAGSLNTARYHHRAILLPNGCVLVVGGHGTTDVLSSAELYDPLSDGWSTVDSLTIARQYHSATLLADGRVLVAGGEDTIDLFASAELYGELGFEESWRPVISAVSSPLTALTPISISGSGFGGVGNTEASSGGTQSSATNYPLVQMRNSGGDQAQWLVPSDFTETSYTAEALGSFPDGPAWITLYVNGIPSVGTSVYVGSAVPAVASQTISDVTATTATGKGEISDLGVPNPTAHGMCWNTTGAPTTGDTCTNEGFAAAVGAFNVNITGMSPYTTYYVKAYATNSAGTAYGGQLSFTTEMAVAAVTTQAVSAITTSTATGNGTITDLGGPAPTAHGVCWNTTGTPTTGDSCVDKGAAAATGPFSANMTGLDPNATYYVRAYATNTAGTSYGGQVSFTTLPQAASLTTQAVSAITTSTATGNGTITDLGVPNPTAHGVCWNTTGTPTTGDSCVDKGAAAASGSFTANMTGLDPNTTYYVRAYATNTAGTAYGGQVSFVTLPQAASLTTQAVSAIGTSTATGNGTITDLGVPNPTAHGVCWNTTGTPTTGDSCVDKGAAAASGSFTANMTGLDPNTTYYVRAYATNTAGTSYGGQVSFTTLPQAASLTTQAVSTITTSTATGNGTITDLGVPNPTAHGVCWNTTGTPTTGDSCVDRGAAAATGSFTANMTGLDPNATYYVQAYATNTAGTSYGGQVSFTTLPQAASLTTQAVGAIGTTTATGNGTITDLGVPNPTAHGVCWNTTGAPNTGDSCVDRGAAAATGAFSANMTGLAPYTTYAVRAYATNTAGTSYGAEVSFTTLPQAADVTTQAVSAIGASTATGNGTITDLGGPAPTAHGVCWNTTGSPTTGDSCADNGSASATGPFVAGMTGLSPNTTYYVRAYATNLVSTVYGDQESFLTHASWTLRIVKEGKGSGVVTSVPADIDCGGVCEAVYADLATVTLNATPENGSRFVGWSGDPDCQDGIVTVSEDVTCIARFTRFPWWSFWPAIMQGARQVSGEEPSMYDGRDSGVQPRED